MSAIGPARGDGVGIEITLDLVRGVRLSSIEPGRATAAAEVPIASRNDDRAIVDALVRLRADLGDTMAPTRVAVFPPGSTLTRIDATGLTGTDLNALRSDLAASRGAASSILVDDGPRRWLIGVTWNDTHIRRLEELTERAGFIDVAIDPSPLAIVRVLDVRTTQVRRDAEPDQSFGAITSKGVVVAAAALDSIGRMAPAIGCSDSAVSIGWFDDVDEPSELVAEIRRLLDAASPVECTLQLDAAAYPDFPPHDVRAPHRQCVALGAAIGAAGLAGRLRPVDMLMPETATTSGEFDRPWAVERISPMPTARQAPKIGRSRRAIARLLPRRR